MPYDRNSELPEGVRKALPESAQTIYRKAYNSAEKKGWQESRRHRYAWGAVKQAGWREPAGEGKWIKEADVEMTEVTEDELRESDSIREATLVPTEPNEEGVSPNSVLIRAGTNKTGRRHYTPEFLKAHIDRFDGAFCNVDHPSRTQERDRPEGSLGTLAAVVENPRFDDAQAVVLGDVRYLDTAAGIDMKAAFSNATVRENAGLSIFSSERCRSRRQKIGEATVDVPVELLGDKKFCIDFVTRPTAGGSVSEIREEDELMPEIVLADVTMDELTAENPDLVEAISNAAVEAAETEREKEQEEEETPQEEQQEQETETPSESDRLTATEKELAEVKQQLRVADGEKILHAKLAEADLLDEGAQLVEADFTGRECADAEKFGAEVDARVEQVKGLIAEAAKAQHVTVPGGVEESDRKPINVGARLREAHGIEADDDDSDKDD